MNEDPRFEKIPPPADPAVLAGEVARLPRDRFLVRGGDLVVFLAAAAEIPHSLYEIGRLREISFRAVGEGTGSALDADWFDSQYQHLVLWNAAREEIAGSYRIGATDELLPRVGVDGLYTSTLFDYGMGLFERIHPALELGRSFVRPEYQKGYAPLLLLWKGIGRFVVRSPRYRYLFGSVSISNETSLTSQRLLVSFLTQRHYLPGLARFVKGRHRLGFDDTPAADGDLETLALRLRELHGSGVPVLVRQYVKLGGRILGFNRDPAFRDAIDALILVDLVGTPRPALERYLGEAGSEHFLDAHRSRSIPDWTPAGWALSAAPGATAFAT